jgi:hypothetical protein
VTGHGDVSRISIVSGDVAESLRQNNIGEVSFGFLDVDLVESYSACFTGLARNIGAGTVIAIHEACYRPIRELVESEAFWNRISLAQPRIEYVAEAYNIPSCRNVGLLFWN